MLSSILGVLLFPVKFLDMILGALLHALGFDFGDTVGCLL